jgi:hypothetical protein
MPSLAKSSSATSLSSQSSATKSPPRKYDGIPPELVEAYHCLCVLVEKEMSNMKVQIPYIPTFDAFLWEAYKVGHVGAKESAKANSNVQHFLQIVLGRSYSGADSMWTYYDFVIIACIGYKYMGDLWGDPTCSWRTVRSLLRWFSKHAFPTSPSLLLHFDVWCETVLEPALTAEPKTAMELLQVVKGCLGEFHFAYQK